MGTSSSDLAATNFISSVQDVIQKQVLGTQESPSQWKLKWSKTADGIKIDNVQLRNQVARKMLQHSDAIVEVALPEEHTVRPKLIVGLQHYINAMNLLLQHRALSKDEQQLFQDHIDDFFEIWLEIFGLDGMSNYIHLLSSSHILYFLEKYQCLYLYSQQGWEALNNTIQAYIHQNSQRGGHGSGQNIGEKSYIFPLVRYLLRDLLWKIGEGDKFFIELEKSCKI
jgi:hypothetical protein